jgi:tight adherence protein C
MNPSMLLSSLLLLLASLLLLSVVLELRRRARQVVQRLDGKKPGDNRFGQWLHALGASRVGQQSVKLDDETQTLLNAWAGVPHANAHCSPPSRSAHRYWRWP